MSASEEEDYSQPEDDLEDQSTEESSEEEDILGESSE